MTRHRFGATVVALALLMLPVTSAAAAARAPHAAAPRASLYQIERQVMCVTCKIPLNVAESPQADRERAYIQDLIDEGRDTTQIKRALVAQYGAALLALMLPRWRARARERAREPQAAVAPLSATDAARLERDLARHDL